MQAKEELGKDAIVMNIKSMAPKGIFKLFRKTIVEVTAALDENKTYGDERRTPIEKSMNNQGQGNKPENFLNSDPLISLTSSEKESAIEEKLNHLQKLLEHQYTEKVVEKETKQEVQQGLIDNSNISCMRMIYNQLLSNEVDEIYVNSLLSEIQGKIGKETSLDHILASIYQKIVLKMGQPRPIQVEEGKTKYVFFIGPTGVGKTTTIAKIASSFLVHQKAKVAMLTADTYRIAAVEQLRTYANILGIPLHVVYSLDEMEEIKNQLSEYDLVLIDTAGRSHRNESQKDDLAELIHTIDPSQRDIYLVLSATTKYNDLKKIADVYSEISDYSLIFTKLDETSCVGNIFNMKQYTEAPLSYTTYGQNVPDDISMIDAQTIAKQILGGSESWIKQKI